MKNYKFDRVEKKSKNIYNTLRGTEELQNNKYFGFLKCKLIHLKGKSLIVPDLVYIMTDADSFGWIQFYSFFAPIIMEISSTEIICSFSIDIALGHVLKLTIRNDGHEYNLEDNSNIFKCEILGPQNIHDFYTGKGKIIKNIPYITLYHHTNYISKLAILDSNFRCSAWNYQGTKKLVNYSYCYFTSLPRISTSADLQKIAMSSNGKVKLILDGTDEIIEIEVYRESTGKRTGSIEMLIDSTIIENNHIWQHTSDIGIVHYEISNSFIYRIGMEIETNIQFSNNQIHRQAGVKIMNYIILGDCNSKDGIIAPFDEEETESIFKIEKFENNNTNILQFWFAHGNQDLYTQKDIDKLIIKST